MLIKSKIQNKTKTHWPNKKRIFDPQSHKENEENENSSVKIDRVEAEIQAYTHTYTHTSIQTFFKSHVFWFLIPRKTIITCFYNNSKNLYHKASSRRKQNIFLQSRPWIYEQLAITFWVLNNFNFFLQQVVMKLLKEHFVAKIILVMWKTLYL